MYSADMSAGGGGISCNGYYSNKSRRLRKKAEADANIPVIVENLKRNLHNLAGGA
jgi:hypothetical protein